MFNYQIIVKSLLLAGLIVSLGACTSNPVVQDYSSQTQFSDYQTYQWLPPHSKSSNALKSQPFIGQRIEQAIIKNLTQRGALIVRQQPQAFVSYGYEVSRTESIEPRTTLGLGWGFRHFGFRTAFPIDYETQVYEDAEWTVNIYDQNKQLIWQGKTTQSVQQFESPKEAEIYTQEIIDKILSQFPPK